MRLLILLLLQYSCLCQAGAEIDSLKKFSYFVYGYKDRNLIEQGTGFFLQVKRKMVFATARHLITGWDTINNTSSGDSVNTFYLRVYDKKDSSKYFLPFNVTEARKTLKNGYAFVHPDLCVFELKGLEPYQINAIEYKKDDYPIKRKIETGYSFGYPVIDSIDDKNSYLSLGASMTSYQMLNDYAKNTVWTDLNRQDSLNYIIHGTSGRFATGISGSPMFLKLEGSGRYLFGGMLILGDTATHDITVLRPEFIINAANSKH